MRTWITLALLVSAALAGCAGDEAPTLEGTDDDGTDDQTQTDTSTETTTTPPSDGNETTDPEPETNTPPTAELTADVVNGTAPLNVTLTLDGSDADGDDLTWGLYLNATLITHGAELPATATYNFTEAGNYTLRLEVNDGKSESHTGLNITVHSGILMGVETFFIHGEGAGDGTMDHTPAEGQEDGHGVVAIAGTPPYSKSYTATEPTFLFHATGTSVEAHVQAFGLAPNPMVTMTGTLYADGEAVGTATSDAQDVVSVALVTTPCTDWTITFELTQDVPVGAELRFDVEADNVVRMASCYPGGTEGPRVILS